MIQMDDKFNWEINFVNNQIYKERIKFKSNQINQVNVKWNNKNLFAIKENTH